MTVRVLIDGVGSKAGPRGVGRYVSSLANALVRLDGVEVVLAAGSWQIGTLEEQLDYRVDVVEAHPIDAGRVGRHLWHRFSLGRLARRSNVDLIHLPDTLPPPDTELPVVATIHDLAEFDLPDAYGSFQRRYRRGVARHLKRSVGQLITVSRFSAGRIDGILGGPVGHVHVVPNGPGLTPASAPGARPSATAPAIDQPFLLFVGGLSRNKNLARIVDAYVQSGRDVDLVIAGPPGNDQETVLRAIRQSSRIRWLAHVDDAELAWLYAHTTALVFPSLYEGFGLPIIEAMSFGAPVITSDVGAVAEVADQAALLVDPHDTGAIRVAISSILDDPALAARLSALGRARSATFDWSRTAAATLVVYRMAIAGTTGQRSI